MTFKLQKKYGSWYCMQGDKIISMCDELAFCFDKESGALFKHGDVHKVQKWMKEASDKFRGAGCESFSEDLVMISSSDWNEEIVNKFINNTGFIKKWYEQEMKNKTNE